MADGQRYQGTLASYKNGWGLITSPSADGKLFCGNKDNPGLESIPVGSIVTFELGQNPKDGRQRAENIRTHSQGVSVTPTSVADWVGHRVNGAVKSTKGDWGFAHSTAFTGDVLVGQKNLRAAGIMNLDPGMPLEFEVAAGSNGNFEAVNISTSMPQQAFFPSTMGNGGARNRSRTPVGPRTGRMVGTVKRFNDGWGFITVKNMDGDVYCNLKDSPDFVGSMLMQGEAVEFQLVTRANSDRNNGAQAVKVRRCNQGMKQSMITAPSALPGGTKSGTVKHWNNGWGFLGVAGEADVFFGLKDNPHIPSASVGDAFVFSVAVGGNGKLKAVNAQPSKEGQRVVGHVKSFRDGWGFCTVEDLEGDVLLGKKNLGRTGMQGDSLPLGAALTFELAVGPKGYEAVNIELSSAAQ